jgi:hypothetical protein
MVKGFEEENAARGIRVILVVFGNGNQRASI